MESLKQTLKGYNVKTTQPALGTTRADYQKAIEQLKEQIAYMEFKKYDALADCLKAALVHAEQMEAWFP